MCLTIFSKKMPSELQKLKRAMGKIGRVRASTRTRYSTVIEDPYKSGYIPPGIARKRGSPKRALVIIDKVDSAVAKRK
jgi:hypothetical protein